MTDEAELLDKISGQLAGIQGTLNRIENGAEEFLPHLRGLLGRKTTRAAARAADLFTGKGGS